MEKFGNFGSGNLDKNNKNKHVNFDEKLRINRRGKKMEPNLESIVGIESGPFQ